MADLWKRLFDTDPLQRQDLDAASDGLAAAEQDLRRLRAALERSERRVDRLQRVVEALVTVLEGQGTVDRDALAAIVDPPRDPPKDPPPIRECVECGRSFAERQLVLGESGAVCVGCRLSEP